MFNFLERKTNAKYVVRSFHARDGWVRVDVLCHPEAGWGAEVFVDVCGSQQFSAGCFRDGDLFSVAYALREAGFFIKKQQKK